MGWSYGWNVLRGTSRVRCVYWCYAVGDCVECVISRRRWWSSSSSIIQYNYYLKPFIQCPYTVGISVAELRRNRCYSELTNREH